MENNLLLAIWLTLLAMWVEHSPFAARARKYADNNRWMAIFVFVIILILVKING